MMKGPIITWTAIEEMLLMARLNHMHEMLVSPNVYRYIWERMFVKGAPSRNFVMVNGIKFYSSSACPRRVAQLVKRGHKRVGVIVVACVK